MEERKVTKFTVKNVLRALSLLAIIFVFCPSFLVSCSGQKIDVSVMTAVGGMPVYGERGVNPYPGMLVCLLIPVGIFVLLLLRKFTDKKTAGIILGSTAIDLVIWLIFRSTVKTIAENKFCSFKTTGWFVLNVIALLIIILLTILIIVNKVQMNTDLVTAFTGGGTQTALNQMSSAVSQMSNAVSQMAGDVADNISKKAQKGNVIGYCSKCGTPIVRGYKFCTSCGTPVPESMLKDVDGKDSENKIEFNSEQQNKEESEKVSSDENASINQEK